MKKGKCHYGLGMVYDHNSSYSKNDGSATFEDISELYLNTIFVGWIWKDLFLSVVRYGELQIRFQRL